MAVNNIVWGPGSAVRPGSAFEVLPDQPLEELRGPSAGAFACICTDRPTENFFALICDPSLPPRHDLIDKLAGLQLANILTPVAWGPVTLPGGLPANSYAVAFERPPGARVVNTLTETIPPFTADDILRRVLPPLVAVLRVFAGIRITHRGIRPNNLFSSGLNKQLMFGDSVCAPPGAWQPIAYETIESGMALPHCRGGGTPADDLYSLGVTLVYLLLGRDLTAAMDPKELLRAKIERGSFMALTNAARLPPELIEIVRGLLSDDERERWTIDDVETWLQGRRLKPRTQSPSGITATRPFEFGGQGYYTARAIAHAFAADPSAAARAIRSAEFDIWLHRSLADEKRSVAVGAVRADAGENRGNLAQDLRLTARTCIALDPLAPIRYGDFATMVDSFGTALQGAFQGRGTLQTIGEVLLARLPQSWMGAQNNLRPEVLALNVSKPFDVLRRFAEDPRIGFGLERVLYELNPMLHCQSPLVQEDYVVGPSELLKALEAAAARGAVGDTIVDRHIAAFVGARTRHVGRDCFDFLNGGSRQRIVGTLGILAQMQSAYGPSSVPALGKLLATQAASLVDIFHSRHRRKRLQVEITKLATSGSLGDLLWLLQSSNEQSNNSQGFANAVQEHAAIEQSLATLRRSEHTRPAQAADLAGHFAMVTSAFLGATIALFAVLRVW